MTYFISYDVCEPKRLCKVAKVLENFGIRVQYFFFECEMDKTILNDLRDKLLSVLNLKMDSLRIYPLCEDCLKKTQSIGNGDIYIPKNYLIL